LIVSLHEDSNKVLRKPYIEAKDYDPASETEQQYFAKCRSNILKRDHSFITELFYGITRTRIVCPDCNHENLNFEHFNMLSVPVSRAKEEVARVVFIHMFSSLYILHKFTLELAATLSFADVKARIADKFKDLPAETLHFYKFHLDDHVYTKVTDETESLAKYHTSDSEVIMLVQDYNPKATLDATVATVDLYFSVGGLHAKDTLGVSKICRLPAKQTKASLYETVYNMISHDSDMLKPDGFSSVFDAEHNKGVFTLLREQKDDQIPLKYGPDPSEEVEMRDGERIVIKITHRDVREERHLSKLIVRKERELSLRDKLNDKALDIYQCLDAYTSTDFLDKQNEWYCSKCKQHKQASICYSIREAPNILIIHLKRFKKGGGFFRKINEMVECPLTDLNLAKYMSTEVDPASVKYDLYGVVNHHGSIGGGHYTACAREAKTDKWFEFDDSSVSAVKSESVITESAYILFYRRQLN
jgi:Ubiquitin carboxyl-terminal hydrolase